MLHQVVSVGSFEWAVESRADRGKGTTYSGPFAQLKPFGLFRSPPSHNIENYLDDSMHG